MFSIQVSIPLCQLASNLLTPECNLGLNAVGMIDCVINNFGRDTGTSYQVLPEDYVGFYVVVVVT